MSGTTSGKPPGSSTAHSRPVRCCNICKRERDLENWFYRTGRYDVWGMPTYDGRCKECKRKNKGQQTNLYTPKPDFGFATDSMEYLFFCKQRVIR